MAYTQTDLDRIDRAIASGTLSVELDGQKITYRSMDELLKARGLIASVVNAGSVSSSSLSFGSFDGDE